MTMAYRGSGLTPFGGGLGSLFGLRREIDRLFEDTAAGRAGSTWVPPVNVRETGDEIALDIELPGINPDNVEITVENGTLTVSGEKREERKEGEEGRYHLVERSYGSFSRSFTLPQGIDEEQINAEFNNGLLSVRIPKAALPQPRRIQIGRSQQQGQQAQIGTQGREQAAARGPGGKGAGRGAGRGGQGEREPMAASEGRRSGENVQE
jgi:HSP20 family protein